MILLWFAGGRTGNKGGFLAASNPACMDQEKGNREGKSFAQPETL